jgi:hypothetical protein
VSPSASLDRPGFTRPLVGEHDDLHAVGEVDAIGQRMAGLAVVITAYGASPSPGRSIRSLVTAPSSLTGRSGCR